ncbi:nucleotidyl transferase AbiEii/AbiGii toxin family protein [Agrobacterium sp. CNPSo 3708]|uniref:nucleotidyl transferase AbiEii/AbiGii toxin family protein n=1 Tax=Agrobacterium sp. CNPSo 3708 TaxID=3028150 RepID=UPI0023642B32|nr:nucleotidyl transferase AbiEii/AbiGii toxin family protein [Agrobacterium sp. CNPSo 3708]MDD1498983.1 nucleotidyl transferase AbiEii/AbiGii toxin family protein [Agrobacterium sp. CNPSo 3708]
MSEDLDEHIAKEEILRLNSFIAEPILLIGGLAVQQYVLERASKDIDIVCSIAVQKALLRSAYGHPRYEKEQKQTDLRPVYEIRNLETGGRVYLGSKILERQSYPFINYDILSEDSVPFRYNDSEAMNIRVPPPHALAFSKLVSYIARRESAKGLQDLEDFCKLTNNKHFSLNSLIALIQRLNAREFLEDFFRSAKLKEAEILLLANSSPIRFQSIFPMEMVLFIAERGRRIIPTFSPMDPNFRLRRFDVEMKYIDSISFEYTKLKSIVSNKNKVGTFYDRYHWTGDQAVTVTSKNPRHVFTERSRKNVWRRYEIDFQRILNEGDEEEVALTWHLTDKAGQFVPFISATIDCHTEFLALRLDTRLIPERVGNVQVEVLPMQGSGEPLELINIESKGSVFEYTCANPRLLHTYEMRWNIMK